MQQERVYRIGIGLVERFPQTTCGMKSASRSHIQTLLLKCRESCITNYQVRSHRTITTSTLSD